MRVIGLLGGMSWESSAEYYRIINEEVRTRLGGTHSARCLLYSFDFDEIERHQAAGDWEAAGRLLRDAARALEAGGAELLVICTNTMHRLAAEVAGAVGIPLVHIADATAAACHRAGLDRVGLLGTRYTMEQEFYRGRLEAKHGLEVLVPDEPDRTIVHDVIYRELVQGVIRDASRARVDAVVGRLVDRGAGGVILGCTELELLVETASVPLFPTTRIHALAAVDAALGDAPGGVNPEEGRRAR